MSSTLKNNAYHILGLDTSASEKDILKRSKEIINRLKADDTPDYDLDIGLFKDFRTEDAVKDALQRLQASKKRIKEYFFWFQIADSVDEQVLGLFKFKDYLNAIRTWQNVAEGQSTKAFSYKKNLAILYCLVLSAEDDKDYLRSSLVAWKELIDSDKFWTFFSEVYKLHDEQTASEDIIFDFKKHVVSYLADIYTDLYQTHKNVDYISQFQKVFSVKGERIEKNVLEPAYQMINNAVDELEKMEVSKDSIFDKEESETIKRLITTIQKELNQLIDLRLYDDSQTKIMRDRSANALRSIALDLHNNLSELDKSRGLLEVAIKFAGMESLKYELQGQLEQIQKNIKDDAENSLTIDVPGTFGRGTVIFKNNYLEYNNKKIFYKDATSISYHAHSQSINFIPASQSFSYMVASPNETISFSFGTTLYIGHKTMQEVWGKLIGLSEGLIESHIIESMVDQIFDRDKPITIGRIEFSKQGYSQTKSKLFGKSEKEIVYWTDTIYTPKFSSGMVVLWKDKNGVSQQFTTIAMSTPNAVVIPGLVKACINRL
ncbi:MAG: hypothetical protein PHE59_03600 [Patescibacteria group bacterium]|nr:hypothetical protein [Patescibacteria group bacterium]MDD5163992.1 hypothetical protein [Patescibacteria group bacterium]MDD5534924.1 hypothetical protein [Patescibacteria group bacterium]